jgi:hypothetical protein
MGGPPQIAEISYRGKAATQSPSLVLVHRLAYYGDVVAGQMAVFQGGPSRTGGKVPISEWIRVERATRKNSQLAAAQKVALKMAGGCVARRLPPAPVFFAEH